MPDTKYCTTCKGSGSINALISQHGDEKEIITCPKCNGKGFITVMTDEEERDYHDDYW